MSPPLYIYNNKLLVDGDKFRGCCCSNRWRIIVHKSTRNNNNCPTIPDPTNTILYEGNVIDKKLKVFPRKVVYKEWINEFPDDLDKYDDPCNEGEKLTLEMNPVVECIFPDRDSVTEEDGKVIKSITKIARDGNNSITYRFTSTRSDDTGTTGANANVAARCQGQNNLPASAAKTKVVKYDIIVNEQGDCCLNNPTIIEAESTSCVVFCCADPNANPKGTFKTVTITDCLKLQISCDDNTWKDIDNPGLTAPTSKTVPGTGHPGINDGWCISINSSCSDQPPCPIGCIEEGAEDIQVKSNLQPPDYYDISALLC